jgi:hypothetical protein
MDFNLKRRKFERTVAAEIAEELTNDAAALAEEV